MKLEFGQNEFTKNSNNYIWVACIFFRFGIFSIVFLNDSNLISILFLLLLSLLLFVIGFLNLDFSYTLSLKILL